MICRPKPLFPGFDESLMFDLCEVPEIHQRHEGDHRIARTNQVVDYHDGELEQEQDRGWEFQTDATAGGGGFYPRPSFNFVMNDTWNQHASFDVSKACLLNSKHCETDAFHSTSATIQKKIEDFCWSSFRFSVSGVLVFMMETAAPSNDQFHDCFRIRTHMTRHGQKSF